MADETQSRETNFPGVLKTGTGAGILVALAIILIFILAATFLRSVVFGIILACFLLPLEKFFEKKFFQRPLFDLMSKIFALFLPPSKIRR